MFYKTGVDITNDKQMFNFLKEHFEYWTMSSWNRLQSIANNVKLYNLDLSGDWCVALSLLEAGEYDTISMLIQDWECENAGYEVAFNGRCGGYLVLTDRNSNSHVLPSWIIDNDTYEEYKAWCREEYCGSVKGNRDNLIYYTKLVQSFDRLCDELRYYCDKLSQQTFEIVEMQKAVEEFNDVYYNDLEYVDFQCLTCDAQGIVDLSEVIQLTSLTETFLRIANRKNEGYTFEWLEDNRIRLKRM
jgi:hypothetical protein